LKPLAVYAGLEPLEFTNLFPYWEVNGTARQLNIKVQLLYIYIYIYIFISHKNRVKISKEAMLSGKQIVSPVSTQN